MQATADIIDENTTAKSCSYKVSLSCGADTRKLYSTPIIADMLSFHISGVPTFERSLPAGEKRSLPAGEKRGSEDLWGLAKDYRANIADSLKVEQGGATRLVKSQML
jgi:hypothetical protein